jgi:hypothetical protein
MMLVRYPEKPIGKESLIDRLFDLQHHFRGSASRPNRTPNPSPEPEDRGSDVYGQSVCFICIGTTIALKIP